MVVKGRSSLCWLKTGMSSLTAVNKTNSRTGKKTWLALDNLPGRNFSHGALNAFIEGAPLVMVF